MSRWTRRQRGPQGVPEPIDAASLDDRCDGLRAAVEAATGRLPEEPVRHAEQTMERVAQRRRFADDLTVIALAGPTGAGKSSLFNALVGRDVAQVAATRPTTGEPTAALWTTPEAAGSLLDWLGVNRRHVVQTDPAADPAGDAATDPSADPAAEPGRDLNGLVLLDLPDHDSTAAGHRETVDHLVSRVDMMIWVLDPQKYADALVHDAYLARLARHEAVTVVLLNQVDRLDPLDARGCVEHLGSLVAEDGLPAARVLGVSARTGVGVDDVRAIVAAAVRDRQAAVHRLAADLAMAADGLREAADDPGQPVRPVPARAGEPLAAAFAQAAGVGLVEQAVGRSVRRSGARATGWPVVRWVHRLRGDPAARLRLGKPGVDPSLVHTSMPSASPVALAEATSAARAYADEASRGAPSRWVRSARAVAAEASRGIGPHLDAALARTDIQSPRPPRWWALIGMLQRLLLAVAAVGAAWLLGLVGLSVLAFPAPETPLVGGLPVPTVLLVGGSVLGIALAVLARSGTRVTANRAAARARAAVIENVTAVARERVVEPVTAEMASLSHFRAGISAAVGDQVREPS
jgi:GTP-binding protein EngB required for normal cell division